MRSILTRLERLENRPGGQIPRFIIEYTDGHKGYFTGADIISHHEGVKRLYYDSQHQPSLDTAVLYQMLYGGEVEVIPTNNF